MYRSWTPLGRGELIRSLQLQFDDEELRQVPGFVLNQDNALSLVALPSGFLIPVRDVNGLIIAIKIRRDETSDGRGKFMALSGGVGGESCGSPTHVPFGVRRPLPMVRITEGELKADIATDLSAVPTIGIPGVSNWHPALQVLEGLRVDAVRLAFDADYITKPQVARELASLAQEIASRGLAVSIERWPIENGKGIDDLLVNGHQPELLTGPQVSEFLSSLHQASDGSIETQMSLPSAIQISAADVSQSPENVVPSPTTFSLLPFPIDVFPAPLQRFAQRVAESQGCPVDLVAVPMLGTAATAIGASRALEIKPGWLESPRMYLAVVSPPGSGKSPVEKLVFRPAYDIQGRYRREYQDARRVFEEALDEARQNTRGRRRGGAVAPPATESPPTSSETESVPSTVTATMEGERTATPSLPLKPVFQRILVGDATVEALAPIMADNPKGMAMIRGELSGWAASMNQYKGGKGADVQFFLDTWSGEAVSVDRKQHEPIFIPHPFLIVMGGIQPDMLPTLIKDKNQSDGFLDRILFAFPESHVVHRWESRGVEPDIQQSWADTLELLFRLAMRHCDDRDVDLPQIVRFTETGLAAWAEWYNAHAIEMESAGFSGTLLGPWSKLKSYCARLALTLHLLRVACGETTVEDVDAESVSRAIRLIDYFKSHARKVYRQLHHDQDDRRVDQVIAWIRSHGGECCSRDLARSNTANIKKTTDANKMLKDLVDRGLGHFENRPGGNNRPVTYFVLS